MNQRTCPRPAHGKLNLLGGKLRKLREAAGWNQAAFTGELQRYGWDIDRAVLVRIESGKRTLTDYELHFILKALNRTWTDLA